MNQEQQMGVFMSTLIAKLTSKFTASAFRMTYARDYPHDTSLAGLGGAIGVSQGPAELGETKRLP